MNAHKHDPNEAAKMVISEEATGVRRPESKNGLDADIRDFRENIQPGETHGPDAIVQDLAEYKAAESMPSEKTRIFLASMVDSSDDSFIGTDLDGRILSWNPAAEKLFEYSAAEAMGQNIAVLFPADCVTDFPKIVDRVRRDERIKRFEAVRVAKSGARIDVSIIITPIRDGAGQLHGVLGNYRDIAERKQAERAREAMEVQLRHSQKLESMGQLAAGIAHEINTPTQYIGDNVNFLKEAFCDLEQLLRHYQGFFEASQISNPAQEGASEVLEVTRNIDLDYLLEEIPKAIDQTIEGVTRVSRLVGAMREFSHPGKNEKIPVDLNRAIDCTIAVTRNEWKYVADLETEYDQSLPPIPCLPGEFNQVILNLIMNASHAIADALPTTGRGKITIRTQQHTHWVEIQIEDTGLGIPAHVRDRIFDPFFTTKEVGRGTGQGLAIARSVVVAKHGGSIHFHTESGKGTTFIIRLPLDGTTLNQSGLNETGLDQTGVDQIMLPVGSNAGQ